MVRKIQMAKSYIYKDNVFIKVWDTDGTVKLERYNVPFIVYINKDKRISALKKRGFDIRRSSYVNIEHEELYEIHFRSYAAMQRGVAILKSVGIEPIVHNDYVWEYMYHNNIICNNYLDRFCVLDIEVDPRGLNMKELTFDNPIIAISLVGYDGQEYVFMVDIDKNGKVVRDSEIELLENTYAVLKTYWCILGWNVIDFDMTYIKNRSLKLGLDLDWDAFPAFDIMKNYSEYIKRAKKVGEVVSRKLDSAAERMLGEHKEQIDIYKIFELMTTDRKKVHDYVLQDSRLVKKLFMIKGIGDLSKMEVAVAQKLHTFPIDTHPTRLFALWFELKARENKIMLPNKWEHYQRSVKKKGAGGLVLEPILGFHKNVFVCDFSSLYPNIIRTHNIGIDNVVWNPSDNDDVIRTMEGVGFRKDIRGLNAQIMDELIEDRFKYRNKLNDPTLTDAERKWYGTMSDAYKLMLVSANGILDNKYFKFRNQRIYEATTLTGQWYTRNVKEIAEELGFTVYYGDSVLEGTPVTIKTYGIVRTVPIEDLLDRLTDTDMIREAKNGVSVWTESGWSSIRYVFRHRVRKKGYRILTKKSFIEVTEDHSLVVNGKEISPKELKVGDKIEFYLPKLNGGDAEYVTDFEALLIGKYLASGKLVNENGVVYRIVLEKIGVDSMLKYLDERDIPYRVSAVSKRLYHLEIFDHVRIFDMCYSKYNGYKIVPEAILNSKEQICLVFLTSFIGSQFRTFHNRKYIHIDGKPLAAGIFLLLHQYPMMKWELVRVSNDEVILAVSSGCTEIKFRDSIPDDEILLIEEFDIDDYVYDLETVNHHFCGGVGGVLLHNTDSLFLSTPTDDVKRSIAMIPIIEQELNDRLRERAIKYFNLNPEWYSINIRFEKMYSKIFFSRKKNYVGRLIWKDYKWLDKDDPDSIDAKGIVMAKYNTLPLIKEVMTRVFDIMLSDIDDEQEIERQIVLYLQKLKADLYAGKRDDLLVVTQRVERLTGYKSNLPHIQAAIKLDKMGKFEPGMNVAFIKDVVQGPILYGVDDVRVSKRTYDFYWRNHVGRWVERIVGKRVASNPELDFGIGGVNKSLI